MPYGLRRNYRAASRRRRTSARYRRRAMHRSAPDVNRGTAYPFRRPITALIRQPLPSRIHRFRRFINDDSFVFTTPTLSPWSPIKAMRTNFGNLPSFSEFSALFDQYRITNITVHLSFVGGNTDDIDNLTGRQLPVVYMVKDIDDTVSGGADTEELLERGNLEVIHMGEMAGNTFVLDVPTYCLNDIAGVDSASAASSNPIRSPWIDVANAGVNHGAIKIGVKGTPDRTYSFSTTWSVNFECIGTR